MHDTLECVDCPQPVDLRAEADYTIRLRFSRLTERVYAYAVFRDKKGWKKVAIKLLDPKVDGTDGEADFVLTQFAKAVEVVPHSNYELHLWTVSEVHKYKPQYRLWWRLYFDRTGVLGTSAPDSSYYHVVEDDQVIRCSTVPAKCMASTKGSRNGWAKTGKAIAVVRERRRTRQSSPLLSKTLT